VLPGIEHLPDKLPGIPAGAFLALAIGVVLRQIAKVGLAVRGYSAADGRGDAAAGSLDEFLDITVKTISPGTSIFSPSGFSMISHFGGRMELTVTRLNFSIPASRSAISNDSSISLCLPTPVVKKTFFGTSAAGRSI